MKIVKSSRGSVLLRISDIIDKAVRANEPLYAIILSDEEWQNFASELEVTAGVVATNGMFYPNLKGMRVRIYRQGEAPGELAARAEDI